ncbi:hypothetical protein OAO94_02175 [Flavobacteriaceae bacterium]|nr:hypothetical protein [Flavobacteriaceae bacterium]
MKKLLFLLLLNPFVIFSNQENKKVTLYGSFGDFEITVPDLSKTEQLRWGTDYFGGYFSEWNSKNKVESFYEGDFNSTATNYDSKYRIDLKEIGDKDRTFDYWSNEDYEKGLERLDLKNKLKFLADSLHSEGKINKYNLNKNFFNKEPVGDNYENRTKLILDFWSYKNNETNDKVLFGVYRVPTLDFYATYDIYSVVIYIKSSDKFNDKIESEIVASISSPHLKEIDKNANYYYKLSKSDRIKLHFDELGLPDDNKTSAKNARVQIELLDKAISLDPENAMFFFDRSYCYMRLRNTGKYLSDINKAIKLDPTNSTYQSDIFYYHSVAFSPVDTVLKYIDNSIKIDNRLGDKLAKAYYLVDVGLFEDAKGILETTLESSQFLKENMVWYKEDYKNLLNEINQIPYEDNYKLRKYYQKKEDYYPYVELGYLDSINYPIKVGVDFELKDIRNFKENKNDDNVEVEFKISANSTYPPKYYSQKILEKYDKYVWKYNWNSEKSTDIADLKSKFILSSVKGNSIADSTYYDDYNNKYVYNLDKDVLKFNHIFKLKDFPFDTQKLKIRVSLDADSSIFKFDEQKMTSYFNEIKSLQEGYKVENINYDFGFEETTQIESFMPGERRTLVKPVADVVINIKRSGSLLFIKLFLGTFLAVLMSLSTFYIDKRNFGSRIDVSVGALFISVGNKYFVESVTPVAQILTKADIINNVSLLLIILNVLIVIGQKKANIKIGRFEDSKYALKFSLGLFLLTLFLTMII